MSVLSDNTIRAMIAFGDLRIEPPVRSSQIQPASIDLRLGTSFVADPTAKRPRRINLDEADAQTFEYPVLPGEFLLVSTYESVGLDLNTAAQIINKSSWARRGLSVANDGGWVDPGYCGQLTLAVVNNSPRIISLKPYDPICQLVLFDLTEPARTYTGRYQNSVGAVAA